MILNGCGDGDLSEIKVAHSINQTEKAKQPSFFFFRRSRALSVFYFLFFIAIHRGNELEVQN